MRLSQLHYCWFLALLVGLLGACTASPEGRPTVTSPVPAKTAPVDGTPSSTPDAAPTSRPTLTPEGEGAAVVDPFLISINTDTNQTIYL